MDACCLHEQARYIEKEITVDLDTALITFAAIAISFFFHIIASAPEEEESLSANDVAQIKRIYLLSSSAPDLALQFAAHLWGDTWQQAHVPLCSALAMRDREEEALQLLERLQEPHKRVALEQMLQSLVDAGQTERALAIHQRFRQSPIHAPMLRSALLLAENRIEDAHQELEVVAQYEQLNETQLLTLARLQHACGQREAFKASLERVAAMLSNEAIMDYTWRHLLQTLADVQDYAGLLELAQRHSMLKPRIAELLAANGRPVETLDVLSTLDKAETYRLGNDAFCQHLLQAGSSELMDRLLEIKRMLAGPVEWLQCALDWYALQGDTTRAQQLLDQELTAEIPAGQHWLLLALAEKHAKHHPQWAASLVRQAERVLVGQQGQESWPHMRLHHLNHLLQEQAKRPANQRDAWSLRNMQEEIERLHSELSSEDRLNEYIEHSRRLQALGETQAAHDLLLKARQQLGAETNLEDEDDRTYYYSAIAHGLIGLGEFEQAKALWLQGLTEEDLYEDLLTAYIDAERLEEAFEYLDLRTLIGSHGASDVERLHRLIAAQKETDPQRYQYLLNRLIDCLNDDSTWRRLQPQQAALT